MKKIINMDKKIIRLKKELDNSENLKLKSNLRINTLEGILRDINELTNK